MLLVFGNIKHKIYPGTDKMISAFTQLYSQLNEMHNFSSQVSNYYYNRLIQSTMKLLGCS